MNRGTALHGAHTIPPPAAPRLDPPKASAMSPPAQALTTERIRFDAAFSPSPGRTTQAAYPGSPGPWPEMVPWLRTQAARWLERHHARLLAGVPTDGVVPVAEVLSFINDAPWPMEATVRTLLDPPVAPPPLATLDRMSVDSGLDVEAVKLLVAAAAPGLSVEVERMYRFLRGEAGAPTIAFLVELVLDGDPSQHLSHWLANAPLVAGAYVHLGPGSGLQRWVEVPEDVLTWLTHGRLAPTAVGVHLPAPWPTSAQDELQAALASDAPLIWLVGPAGSGRRGALAAAAGPCVWVRPQAPETWAAQLGAGQRRARLAHQPLAVDLDGVEVETAAACLRDWMPQTRCILLTHQIPRVVHSNTTASVHAPPKSLPWCAAQWQHALAGDGRAWPADLPRRLARRFAADPLAMRLALQDVGGPPRVEALHTALRQRVHHGLDTLATPFTTSLTWADLVVPAEVERSLQDILNHARHQELVLQGWGFDRLLPYGRGLGCLFAGPPGTGKTMVAGLLAQALDLEIHRVDTSKLVSKWLGETEKNLARLFEAAEQARAILFFDEADSLFGKRTEVKGSNDRFANMEVNELLQRMERFDGIAILATNLHQSMDDAFRRRFRFIVHFEEPDAEARALLWARMLPATAPRAPDLCFDQLGRRFKLTGGHIKNAMVRAAFLAAAQASPIHQALLIQAASEELRALGRL